MWSCGSSTRLLRRRCWPAWRRGAGQDVGPWRHWKLQRDQDDVLWLVLDKSGASANTLSQDVLEELDDALGKIEGETAKGLVLRSAKPAGFIAGADVNELREA